jgi:hypothetical protein
MAEYLPSKQDVDGSSPFARSVVNPPGRFSRRAIPHREVGPETRWIFRNRAELHKSEILRQRSGDKMTNIDLPRLHCHKTRTPITVDGLLEEAEWLWAPCVELRLNSGSSATHRTMVRSLWDSQCLYFGFDCEDPDPSAQMTGRDDPLFEEGNIVEVFINPASTGVSFYEFEVNPLNALLDLFYVHPDQPWREAAKWHAEGIKTAARIHQNHEDLPMGWSVEIAIPWENFTTARSLPPNSGDSWRVNFYRYDTIKLNNQKVHELCAWSPTLQNRFAVPDRFGFLIFDE